MSRRVRVWSAQPSTSLLCVSLASAIAHTEVGPLGQYTLECLACAMLTVAKFDVAGLPGDVWLRHSQPLSHCYQPLGLNKSLPGYNIRVNCVQHRHLCHELPCHRLGCMGLMWLRLCVRQVDAKPKCHGTPGSKRSGLPSSEPERCMQ